MKIRVEHGDFDENEVVLRCKELNEEMLEILTLLKERTSKLTAFCEGEIHMIAPPDVYYAEAVDGKTFLYTKTMVLETYLSLAALQDEYSELGIIRIGKSQLINLHHVKKLKSLPNSRIQATLKNDEKLIVSRHYIHLLKDKLGILE